MVEVKNLYKSYGNLSILENISFSIEKNEWTMLVGSSGCGKTTLLYLLGLMDSPQKGSIEYDLPKTKSLSSFRQKNFGFVFQNFNLISELTALENVILPALFTKRKKKDIIERAKALIKMVGIQERFHHRPNQLSGGEQQRLAIARALINSPQIILADEPTGNLDQNNAQKVIEIFLKLKQEGKTIIMVTHSTQFTDYADKIIDLSKIKK